MPSAIIAPRDEVSGRVAHLPWCCSRALVKDREPSDHVAQPISILEELDRAVGMNGDIVPGRHDLPGVLLCRIPSGCDVGFLPHKGCETFSERRDAPLR